MTLLDQTAQAETRQPNLNPTHYIPRDLTIPLSNNKGLRKPMIQINKEKIRVILRQTSPIYLHNTLQIIHIKFPQTIGFQQILHPQLL
jgi:hypothetical protein